MKVTIDVPAEIQGAIMLIVRKYERLKEVQEEQQSNQTLVARCVDAANDASASVSVNDHEVTQFNGIMLGALTVKMLTEYKEV